MTLNDFYLITKKCSMLIANSSFAEPNAVCVSRKIYNDLTNGFDIIKRSEDIDTLEERVFGIALFVDDDMPDEFYCVGQAKTFIDYFTNKNKFKKIEGIKNV